MPATALSILLLIAVLTASAACLGPVAGLYPPGVNEKSTSIYVVTQGWHTGIAIRAADVPSGLWPERADFPRAQFLEVGWGERDYWQSPRATSGLALNAGLRPNPSALRVIALAGPIEDTFVDSDIVAIDLSRPGFERLITFIHESYAPGDSGRAVQLGPGPVPNSRYYLARGNYHAFNTSNKWTARALRTAGLPITPAYALTASNVLWQASPFSRIVRSRPPQVVP